MKDVQESVANRTFGGSEDTYLNEFHKTLYFMATRFGFFMFPDRIQADNDLFQDEIKYCHETIPVLSYIPQRQNTCMIQHV